jgi:outer membrane protein assembly factor BamA
MLSGKPQTNFTALVAAGVVLFLMVSCAVVPKDYPPNRPFVYETNIRLEGNFTKEERLSLQSQLKNQLDDSIRVRTVYKFLYKGINRQVLLKPPVYDSANADRSVASMKSMLNKLGYFRSAITYDTSVEFKETKPPQYRTTVNFTVKPGRQFKLDSVSYVINHTELQALTDGSRHKSLLKKDVPFSQPLISDELNRLVELYRENGYMRFSFNELAGVWDTLYNDLLRPTVDPFEQIEMLEKLRSKIDTPVADIEIRLRPGYDVEKLTKYYVGHSTIYTDTARAVAQLAYRDNNFSIYQYHNFFKPKFIIQNIYFRRGDLYNEKQFLKTINRFNQLGAWRLVNIEQMPRAESDTVDFTVLLTPAEKLAFTANLEGSINNSNSLILEENLLGIGVNVQLLNRNFGRTANLSSTAVRYSTEVNTKGEFVKTRQASISHSISFPKPIPNVKWIPERFRDNFKTVLTASLGNIERNDFFNLTSINASWGYSFSWRNKTFSLKFPNIEYAYVRKRDSLVEFLNQNPSLKTVFPENGLVLSVQSGFTVRWGRGNTSQFFRANIEESGLLTNLINLKLLDSLFRFIKLDAEYIRNISLGKNSFIFRTYAGAGFALRTKDRSGTPNLPFFKQFSAGGPYSMRAWGLRTLGPGSTVEYRSAVPIRFGDFQFETNAEFRFPLFRLGRYLTSSCVFADVGNIWFLKPHSDFPDGTLSLNKFFKDMAVGIGTGIRVDFEFFRVRLDYGLRVRNPSPEPDKADGQFKWFYHFKPLSGILQLGINYPFSF